jgi:DNA-binding GntR family transcriptional regulator
MPIPTEREVSRRTLLRDAVYERLLWAITDGTLAPMERIRDTELGAWLGSSRTPIREALARLEREGLVESAPNRYTRVSPMTARAAAESFPIAAALHGLAAGLAAGRTGAADLQTLRSHVERHDWAVWRADVGEAVVAHAALHDLVLGRAGSSQLAQMTAHVMVPLRRMEWQTWPALPEHDSSAWHERLIGGLSRGDTAAAADAARLEWLGLGRQIERALAGAERQAERRSSVAISCR